MSQRNTSFSNDRKQLRRKRGSAYILVLITAAILTVAGLSTVAVSRISMQTRGVAEQWTHAQELSRAGLEYALVQIDLAYEADNAAWRDGFTSSEVLGPVIYGEGSFTWQVIDSDGDFGNDDTQGFEVQVAATVGDATYTLRATMEIASIPNLGPAIDSLGAPLTCASMVVQDATVTSDQAIHINGNINAQTSQIKTDVTATSITGSGTYFGTNTSGAAPRELPSSDVFEPYLEIGTVINKNNLAHGKITDVVLSPASNPYGEKNPQGVYIIDMQGDTLEIMDCRIVGTLILLNVNDLKIMSEVNWEPAIPRYPALMADATRVLLETTGEPLDEDSTGVNFNPASTPWQGEADNDMTDTYPCAIAGVVYIDSEIEMKYNDVLTIEGSLLVSGKVTIDKGELTLRYRDYGLVDPPPGFTNSGSSAASGPPRVVSGSVIRVID